MVVAPSQKLHATVGVTGQQMAWYASDREHSREVDSSAPATAAAVSQETPSCDTFSSTSRPLQKLQGDSGGVTTEGQQIVSSILKFVHSTESPAIMGTIMAASLQVTPCEMTVYPSSSTPSQKLQEAPSFPEGQQYLSNICKPVQSSVPSSNIAAVVTTSPQVVPFESGISKLSSNVTPAQNVHVWASPLWIVVEKTAAAMAKTKEFIFCLFRSILKLKKLCKL